MIFHSLVYVIPLCGSAIIAAFCPLQSDFSLPELLLLIVVILLNLLYNAVCNVIPPKPCTWTAMGYLPCSNLSCSGTSTSRTIFACPHVCRFFEQIQSRSLDFFTSQNQSGYRLPTIVESSRSSESNLLLAIDFFLKVVQSSFKLLLVNVSCLN